MEGMLTSYRTIVYKLCQLLQVQGFLYMGIGGRRGFMHIGETGRCSSVYMGEAVQDCVNMDMDEGGALCRWVWLGGRVCVHLFNILEAGLCKCGRGLDSDSTCEQIIPIIFLYFTVQLQYQSPHFTQCTFNVQEPCREPFTEPCTEPFTEPFNLSRALC